MSVVTSFTGFSQLPYINTPYKTTYNYTHYKSETIEPERLRLGVFNLISDHMSPDTLFHTKDINLHLPINNILEVWRVGMLLSAKEDINLLQGLSFSLDPEE